jgi:hypothetical protein
VPANAVFESILLGNVEWTKLADEPTVVHATIIASSKNAGSIDMRFRGGPVAKWPPGAAASLEAVDLWEFEVKGQAQHRVLVAGYAPGDSPRGRSASRLLPPVFPYEIAGEIGGGVGGTG